MNAKLLNIYLNDHLAGATIGIELARRCRSNNQGTALGAFLDALIAEIESDREDLKALMDSLGCRKDVLKQAGGWFAEKVGRLKLNGNLTSYSDLSRLEELEGLSLGVQGKLSLWKSLKQIENHDPRLVTFDLERLIKRAEQQREQLEKHRLEAARRALA
jgi:hypothetical protein